MAWVWLVFGIVLQIRDIPNGFGFGDMGIPTYQCYTLLTQHSPKKLNFVVPIGNWTQVLLLRCLTSQITTTVQFKNPIKIISLDCVNKFRAKDSQRHRLIFQKTPLQCFPASAPETIAPRNVINFFVHLCYGLFIKPVRPIMEMTV